MDDYLSILIYFMFFLGGFYIDAKIESKVVRKGFVFFLYIFLCFGYMTGSDWRGYELSYEDADYKYSIAAYERGFYYFQSVLHKLIPDFWVYLGVLKCLYLYTIISLLKRLTDKWFSALSFLLPLSLLFMLIDNPLRFMVANTVANVALIFYLKGNKLVAVPLLFLSILFHFTFFFIFIFFYMMKVLQPFLLRQKITTIIYAYIIVSIIFSDESLVLTLFNFASDISQQAGAKSYESYTVSNNSSFFTIGSFLRIIIGVLFISQKKSILTIKQYGKDLYAITVLQFFLSRILLLVPTGFRLTIPFHVFYAVAIIALLYYKKSLAKRIALIICFMYALILIRDLWRSYSYIPYSNSIYYILTEHKPYSERWIYNLDEYTKRTGKTWDNE